MCIKSVVGVRTTQGISSTGVTLRVFIDYKVHIIPCSYRVKKIQWSFNASLVLNLGETFTHIHSGPHNICTYTLKVLMLTRTVILFICLTDTN